MLTKIGGVKKAIEVGVFTGYSSLCIATSLPEDGKLFALDVSVEFTDIARKFWIEAGVEHKVDLRLGPALDTLDKLLADGHEGTFDFAFLDADKAHYDLYYERLLKLVRLQQNGPPKGRRLTQPNPTKPNPTLTFDLCCLFLGPNWRNDHD